MDMPTDILGLLNKLDNSLKCPICSEKCVEPVRIKTCGHYFCDECLKSLKESHNCPKCNEAYYVKDLDYDNIAKATKNDLAELRKLLESISNPSNLKRSKDNVATDNTIIYNQNRYHINFINTINKINTKGETLLHLACKRKKFDEVKALVESKVDINAKDYAGWAPLHEAVQSESLEIIEYLLQNHCLINIPGADYVTPLHQAVSLDNIEIIKVLLKYGADKNVVDYSASKPENSTKNQSVKEILEAHNPVSEEVKLFELFLPGKVFLYCHSIDECDKKKLQNNTDIQVVDKMEIKKNLTHFVIKKTHKLSFKIMQAMLEGLQFVTEDCIENYLKGNYFVNIPEHVFLKNNANLNNGIRKAMISALLKLPKLFDGIHFYIEDHISPVDIYNLKVDKEYLTKLIKAGGGRVLHRPPATRTCESEYTHSLFSTIGSGTYRCCNFILYAENKAPDLLYNMSELQHKSSKWLIDCIIQYEIRD